jgi:hypothetical protein
MDDKWFRELIKPLPASSDHAHPSRADLRAYLHGRLPDIWRTGAHSPDAWTLTEVSQHLLICEGCAQQLALMRRQELEQSHASQGALRTHIVMLCNCLGRALRPECFPEVMVPSPAPVGLAALWSWDREAAGSARVDRSRPEPFPRPLRCATLCRRRGPRGRPGGSCGSFSCGRRCWGSISCGS